MAEIVNFRRAKKAKARGEAEEKAAGNRTTFGTAKKLRDLAKARREKDAGKVESHKLDDESSE
ncbi:MAG TPA: DUF4169 family protein [Rhizomicrobium sp.]|nr:DUF4169 family protein [Rhizomicrobium sp.]